MQYKKSLKTNYQIVWNERLTNRFQCHLLPFISVALHEPCTRNGLLCPNNTDVYFAPFISTQNHTIAG